MQRMSVTAKPVFFTAALSIFPTGIVTGIFLLKKENRARIERRMITHEQKTSPHWPGADL